MEYRRFLICNFCVIGNVDPHFICEKNVSWVFTSFFVVWSLYKPLEEVWRTKKTFLEHLLWSISIMVFSFCLLSFWVFEALTKDLNWNCLKKMLKVVCSADQNLQAWKLWLWIANCSSWKSLETLIVLRNSNCCNSHCLAYFWTVAIRRIENRTGDPIRIFL